MDDEPISDEQIREWVELCERDPKRMSALQKRLLRRARCDGFPRVLRELVRLREALLEIDHEAKDNDVTVLPIDDSYGVSDAQADLREAHRVFDRICELIERVSQ